MKKALRELYEAAEAVMSAYLAYGPVEDGRPEGKAFEEALDKLSLARFEAKYTLESPK